jgi:hypothetical protein
MKYTPGPWKVERGNSGSERPLFVVAPNKDGLRPWCDADAHLIAAAPDLFEALVRVQNLSAEYYFPLSLVIAINTAIAKAEPELTPQAEPELTPHRFTYKKSHQSGQCGRCGLPYEDDIHAYRIDAAVCGHVGTFRGSKCRHCGLEVK